ncbi:DUF3592 domain-containing protein [Glaciecola sp. MH2013]|nr:DUF3592 domain-containing protein [Glaciecola sp. MH2013]
MITKYALLLIGIALLFGAFLIYQNTLRFLETAVTSEGTVIELIRSTSNDSNTFAPVVEFETPNGRSIVFKSNSYRYPPAYMPGEKVEVLFAKNAPNDARINGFFSLWGPEAILGLIGAGFFLFGFSMIAFGLLKGNKIKYLQEHGIPIEATFESVRLNSSFEVNGQSPYNIFAKWTDPSTSHLHTFKSDNIWFDPSFQLNQQLAGQVSEQVDKRYLTVLIEKGNPKKYHVDISFLTE